jgi:hypothetical protein
LSAALALTGVMAAGQAEAAPIYLNSSNITVTLGPGMAAEPFANRTAAASLASVIDAPTAAAGELHNQSTHVWVSGGSLDLRFDFGVEYDLSQLHFWNYHSEGFDVDNIAFTFFNAGGVQVGALNAQPALGNATGNDSTPIFAENYALAFPSNVRFVTAVLTGSNNQVDFNNIGFTAELSNPDPDPNPAPEPATMALFALGMAGLGRRYGRTTFTRQ